MDSHKQSIKFFNIKVSNEHQLTNLTDVLNKYILDGYTIVFDCKIIKPKGNWKIVTTHLYLLTITMEDVEICKNIKNFYVIDLKDLYAFMSTLEKTLLNGEFAKVMIKALFQEYNKNHIVNNILKENFIEYKVIEFANTNKFTDFYDEVFELICIGCVLEIRLFIYEKVVITCSKKENDGDRGIDTVDEITDAGGSGGGGIVT